jgi:hypothetical protein
MNGMDEWTVRLLAIASTLADADCSDSVEVGGVVDRAVDDLRDLATEIEEHARWEASIDDFTAIDPGDIDPDDDDG